MAIHQYSQGYDELLPLTNSGTGGINAVGGVYFSTWPANTTANSFDIAKGNIFPYTKNIQINICPSDTQGQASGNSYAWNHCVSKQDGISAGRNSPISLASIQAPSAEMLLGEESFGGSAANSSTDDGYLGFATNMTTRHLGGGNVAFVDGHVKFYRPEQAETAQLLSGGNGGGNSCPP